VSPVKRNAHTRIIGHDRRLVLFTHTYTRVKILWSGGGTRRGVSERASGPSRPVPFFLPRPRAYMSFDLFNSTVQSFSRDLSSPSVFTHTHTRDSRVYTYILYIYRQISSSSLLRSGDRQHDPYICAHTHIVGAGVFCGAAVVATNVRRWWRWWWWCVRIILMLHARTYIILYYMKAEWREKRHTCDPELENKKKIVFFDSTVYSAEVTYEIGVRPHVYVRKNIIFLSGVGDHSYTPPVIDRNRKTIIDFRPLLISYCTVL